MNLLSPTPRGGLHRTLRVLSLLLLQHALVPSGPEANARSRLPEDPNRDTSSDGQSRPYLKVAGALALRFSEAPRALPIPQSKVIAPSAPVQPLAAVSRDTPPLPTPLNPGIEAKVVPNELPINPPVSENNRPALSILPDNTQPSSRPEDFLPYFQFPAGRDTSVIVPGNVARPPAPNPPMPASSATYQQR